LANEKVNRNGKSNSRKLTYFLCNLAIEVICGHLTTLLSQPNWRLRATLFDSLVTVASYIGIESEVFIRTLLDQV
jgi:intein/homing endonuclease